MKVQQISEESTAKLIPINKPEDYSIRKDLLIIRDHKSIRLLPKAEILYCQSSSNYTFINLTSGEKILSSKCLKEIQRQLVEANFMRIHASYLINLDYLEQINFSPAKSVLLQKAITLPVSKSRFSSLTKLFTPKD